MGRALLCGCALWLCASLAGCGAAAGGRPAGATQCGWDGAGACPSIGQGGLPAAARQIGVYREIDLSTHFTNDAVTTLAAGLRYGGLGGGAFPASRFPSAGTLTLRLAGDQQVPFLIPDFGPGRRSVLSLAHRTVVAVPPGTYSELWMLETAVGGNIGPLPIGLAYAGGGVATVAVTFGDWCNGGFPLTDAPPEFAGITLPEVLSSVTAMDASATAMGESPLSRPRSPSLARFQTQCGLWAEQVLLPTTGVRLTAVVLPADNADVDADAFVMAMTLVGMGAGAPAG